MEEYELAKKTFLEGHSSGEDNIYHLKYSRDVILLISFCSVAMMLSYGGNPDQWSILNIIPIPNSGDLSQGGNNRGISLRFLVAKSIILERIHTAIIDNHLRFIKKG
jgi:hypothetical protein